MFSCIERYPRKLSNMSHKDWHQELYKTKTHIRSHKITCTRGGYQEVRGEEFTGMGDGGVKVRGLSL